MRVLVRVRESYLPILDEIQSYTSPLNWRFRLLLANQLPQLAELFSPAATCSVVVSVTMKMLDDSVCAVREAACQVLPGGGTCACLTDAECARVLHGLPPLEFCVRGALTLFWR